MIPYPTKASKLSGTSYREVRRNAELAFKPIKRATHRTPYVRSAYFSKQKVFFNFFWDHIIQKSFPDRVRRLKYFACAIELIRRSRSQPILFENPSRRSEILHRFAGLSHEGELFFVQIKEDKKTGRKYLISVFPEN